MRLAVLVASFALAVSSSNIEIVSGPLVRLNGYQYRALRDNVNANSQTPEFCGDSNATMPDGFSLAHDTADSVRVIAAYPWQTRCVAVSTGGVYFTKKSGSAAGSVGTNCWRVVEKNGYYHVKKCFEILVRRKEGLSGAKLVDAYTVDYRNNRYRMLAGGVRVNGIGANKCGAGTMPAGYSIAPDTAESRAVIGAYTWDTEMVAVKGNAIAYNTAKRVTAGKRASVGATYTVSGNSYTIRGCPLQVLIYKMEATVVDAYTVLYDGNTYRMLHNGVRVQGTGNNKCGNSRQKLPAGFSIAPNTPTSAKVIGAYPWDTEIVAVAGNAIAYSTAKRTNRAGTRAFVHGTFKKVGDGYYAVGCPVEILVWKIAAKVIHGTILEYQGYLYRTLRGGVPVEGSANGCQGTSWRDMPSGWSLAPDTAATVRVIESYTWQCDHMAISTKVAYQTKRIPQRAGQKLPSRMGQKGNRYRCTGCPCEILIRKPAGSGAVTEEETMNENQDVMTSTGLLSVNIGGGRYGTIVISTLVGICILLAISVAVLLVKRGKTETEYARISQFV